MQGDAQNKKMSSMVWELSSLVIFLRLTKETFGAGSMLRSPQEKKEKRKIDDGKIIWGENFSA